MKDRDFHLENVADMKNQLVLCLVLLSITCSCKGVGICSVSETKKSYVTALAINMGRNVGPCATPNPSVLIALNLGPVKDPTAQDILVKQLQDDAADRVSKNETFTSGKVALYVLALRSSCVNPSNIAVSGESIDLVQILEVKTREELQPFENNQPNATVLTTWYQVGLDVLGLCVMSRPYAISAASIMASHISASSCGSVDTAAVVVMGLACVLKMENVTEGILEKLKNSMSQLLKYILDQQNNGVIGNIYSTGLAGQALLAAKAYYSIKSWNCSATIEKVISLIPQKTFSLPIAAAQLLPFLWGESYVSIKCLRCKYNDVRYIRVEFTIANDLIGENFKHSIFVEVRDGSTLLQVMQKAAEQNPQEFSFKSEKYDFGVYITAINNLDGSTNGKTYWQFFNGDTPLTEGVSDYIPQDKAHIIAIFSKY